MFIDQQFHLSYCTNIHAGERWNDVLESLKQFLPPIKAAVAPNQAFGLGLRLSNQASEALVDPATLQIFKQFLKDNNCYVFTMNGFPYGDFHRTIVKDAVHLPDWGSQDRLDYTIRLFDILKELLPAGMEGGISTSPLSYRLWHIEKPEQLALIYEKGIQNLAQVVIHLARIRSEHGCFMHLDIEPEPDGLMDCTQDVLDFYQNLLVPKAAPVIATALNITMEAAEQAIYDHLQLCYDVCHFAVMFEDSKPALEQLLAAGIKIGKVQISAALKANFTGKQAEDDAMREVLQNYAESTYLHQVVLKDGNSHFHRYNDLSTALAQHQTETAEEWRTHFHVPIFLNSFGQLVSTQSDIIELLEVLTTQPFTQHLEVETYTWEVLPSNIKTDLTTSIIRELRWVIDQIQSKHEKNSRT